MYKNFRVGGGIVLGLSALVLGLVGYTSHIDTHIDNIKKLNEIDTFQIKSGETFGLCTSLEDITETDSYVFSYGSGDSRVITGSFNTKYLTSISSKTSAFESIGIISFESTTINGSYYIKFKDNANDKYLYASGASSMKLNTKSSASTWTINFKDKVLLCTASNDNYGTIQYNTSNPRFLNYTSKQNSIFLYKLLSNDSKSTFKRDVSTDSNVSFKYSYYEEGKKEVLHTVETAAKGTGSSSLTNGTFSYDCDSQSYADGGAKFATDGDYYELNLNNPVDNPYVTLNYKLNSSKAGNVGENSLIFSFFDSNDEIKGTYSYNLGDDTNTEKILIDTKEKSFNLKNISKIKIELSKNGYNCSVKDVVFYAGDVTKTYSNFNTVYVQLWMDYSNNKDDIVETGLLVTAKNGFTIENGIISLPTQNYIKTFVNKTLEKSYFAKVTFTDEEVVKYYDSSITFIPFAKVGDEYVFADARLTTLKAEVEKISDADLKNNFIKNYNL